MSGRALKNTLLNQWFTYLTPCPKPDKFKPGDILISPTHVEMYTLNGKVVWAHDDKDREPWDSGWEEISVRNIEKVLKYMKPSWILRYTWESTT